MFDSRSELTPLSIGGSVGLCVAEKSRSSVRRGHFR